MSPFALLTSAFVFRISYFVFRMTGQVERIRNTKYLIRNTVHEAPSATHGFFFRQISASGFGLMRCAWGAVVFYWMLLKAPEIAHYYTDEGFLPLELGHLVFRSANRFTILDYVTSPGGVTIVYLLLLTAAFLTSIGWKPRCATIATVILFFSFQERNLLPLGGGDTVLRNLGFLLAICPELRAFSVERLKLQWQEWRRTKKLLPPLRMSIWPYRLLLWQVLIFYVASGWEKATGTMWWNGTAVEAVYHHPHFAQWPRWLMDSLSPLGPFVGYYTLLFEFLWLLLLIPRPLQERVIRQLPRTASRWITPGRIKRGILLLGVLFHIGIWVVADVGIFPFAMMCAYLGLLLDDDFASIKTFLNRRWHRHSQFSIVNSPLQNRIAVLYDGKCGLCQRSVFGLAVLDPLERLHLVNFHNESERTDIAPELKFEDLDKAMHIKFPSGKTFRGFDAFRALCWHLPALWPAAPLLHLPGIAPIGRRIYARISESRKKCTHEECRM